MRNIEFSIEDIENGAYYPGVFIVALKQQFHDGMSYSDFSKEDWQTFVHEYIHFLQDISTSQGYLYYFHKSQIFNLCFYTLQNSDSYVVKLPIRIEETNVSNALEKETLLDFYLGDNKYIKCHNVIDVKYENDELASELIFSGETNQNISKQLHTVNIYYNDGQGVYQFGNLCVKESMAYLIERHLFGAEERTRELPYNACELICEILCPELLDAPMKIVQLCEVSLFWDNCGEMFYHLVKLCKMSKLANLIDNDFRDFCVRNVKSRDGLFSQAYAGAYGGVDTLFPPSFPYTYATNKQIKAYLECGYKYRKEYPLFISDIFKNAANASDYIMTLVDLLGLPIIKNGDGTFYSGTVGAQNMPVADAVMDVLIAESQKGCKLQGFCRESHIRNYDPNRCTRAPWEQCAKEEICPFAVYLIGHGVDKLKYSWRER